MPNCHECSKEFSYGDLRCSCGADLSGYEPPVEARDEGIPDLGGPETPEPEQGQATDAAPPQGEAGTEEPYADAVTPSAPPGEDAAGSGDAAVSEIQPGAEAIEPVGDAPPAGEEAEAPEGEAGPDPTAVGKPVEAAEETEAPQAAGGAEDEAVPEVEPSAEPVTTGVKGAAEPTGKCERCGGPSATAVCPVCAESPAPHLILAVEGYDPVFYKGRKVQRVAIAMDEVLIGRRDVGEKVFPEIDLREFYKQEVGFVSRTHARILYELKKHFVVDVAGRETTALVKAGEQEQTVLPTEKKVELNDGDRLIVGDAVSFTVIVPKDD